MALSIFIGAIDFPAYATDGVIEINQAVVESSGGFPYMITQRGSYRLTGNLVVPNYDTTAIMVTQRNTHIDLNGFVITGPLSGDPSGTGVGIDAPNSGSIEVRNGQILRFGKDGINAGGGVFENLLVNRVGRHGLNVGIRSVVRNVRSIQNLGDGVLCGDQCQIADTVSSSNSGRGIAAGAGATIRGSTSTENASDGIAAGVGSVIENNVSSVNANAGLRCAQSCLILDNMVQGNSGPNNGGIGILIVNLGGTTGRSLVRGNVVTNNANLGLSLLGTGANLDGFTGNVLNNNNGTGAEVGGGLNLGSNICNGSADSSACR